MRHLLFPQDLKVKPWWPGRAEASHRPAGQAPLRQICLWWRNGREGETEWSVHCREKGSWRGDDNEERADIGGPCCHLGPYKVLSNAVTQGHIWVCSPTAAGVCVDWLGLYYHQGSWKSWPQGSGPTLRWPPQWKSSPPHPSLALGKTDPTTHHAQRGAEADGVCTGELALTFTWERAVPAESQTDKLSYDLGPHLGFWTCPPQHPPHLWPAGVHERTSPTEPELQDPHDWGNNRTPERSFCEGPVLMVWQKSVWQRVWSWTRPMQWAFTSKAVWANGYTVRHTIGPRATATSEELGW